MPTKTTTITAQSKLGWALSGHFPQETGTIAIVSTPPETAQWFVGIRSSRGTSADKCYWWPIVSIAQISPEGVAQMATSDTAMIQSDILNFLGDFSLQVEYEVPTVESAQPERKKTRSLRLSDRAWRNIQANGGASMVEKWANEL